MPRLPKTIIPISCVDKEGWYESWDEPHDRDELCIPHPFAIICAGKPNSGKSTIAKNILLRHSITDKPFEILYIVHTDPDTKEYDDVGGIMLNRIPTSKDLDSKTKQMIILDDLNFKAMKKTEKKALDRLFGYCRTHMNLSICLCVQCWFSIPVRVRQMSNCYVLWRSRDLLNNSMIARRVGMKADEFDYLLKKYCTGRFDSLWIDFTPDTPYPLRHNGYNIIENPFT